MAHMYSVANNETFPGSVGVDGHDTPFLSLDVGHYTVGTLTRCPTMGLSPKSGGSMGAPDDSDAGDYGYNLHAHQILSTTDVVMIADWDEENHNSEGANVGYVDGSTRWYGGDDLAEDLHLDTDNWTNE